MAAYFKGAEGLSGSPLGFGIETITHTFRLITSGLFDEHPNLKIIVGHLGEAAPFLLWRTEENLKKVHKMPKSFVDYYKQHFYVTTSGAFQDTALACTIAEMGIDHVMFAIDWPYISNTDGVNWLKKAPVSEQQRTAIFSGNAKKLLKL